MTIRTGSRMTHRVVVRGEELRDWNEEVVNRRVTEESGEVDEESPSETGTEG